MLDTRCWTFNQIINFYKPSIESVGETQVGIVHPKLKFDSITQKKVIHCGALNFLHFGVLECWSVG